MCPSLLASAGVGYVLSGGGGDVADDGFLVGGGYVAGSGYVVGGGYVVEGLWV